MNSKEKAALAIAAVSGIGLAAYFLTKSTRTTASPPPVTTATTYTPPPTGYTRPPTTPPSTTTYTPPTTTSSPTSTSAYYVWVNNISNQTITVCFNAAIVNQIGPYNLGTTTCWTIAPGTNKQVPVPASDPIINVYVGSTSSGSPCIRINGATCATAWITNSVLQNCNGATICPSYVSTTSATTPPPPTTVYTPPPPTTTYTPPPTTSTPPATTSTPPSTTTPTTSGLLTVTFVNKSSYAVTITNNYNFNTGLSPGQTSTYQLPAGTYYIRFPTLGIQYSVNITKSTTIIINNPTTTTTSSTSTTSVTYYTIPTINPVNQYLGTNGEPLNFIQIVNPYNQWVTVYYETQEYINAGQNLNNWYKIYPPFVVYPVPPNYQIYIPYLGPGVIKYKGFNKSGWEYQVSVSSPGTVTLQQVSGFDTPQYFGMIVNNLYTPNSWGVWVQAGGYYSGDQFYMWMPPNTTVVVPWSLSIVNVQSYGPSVNSGGENPWVVPMPATAPANMFGCYNPPNFVQTGYGSVSSSLSGLSSQVRLSFIAGQVSYAKIYGQIAGIQAPCGVYQYLIQLGTNNLWSSGNLCKAGSVSPPQLTSPSCSLSGASQTASSSAALGLPRTSTPTPSTPPPTTSTPTPHTPTPRTPTPTPPITIWTTPSIRIPTPTVTRATLPIHTPTIGPITIWHPPTTPTTSTPTPHTPTPWHPPIWWRIF
ncbi:hypothetical protein [Los Azufres archaeal virus 1]|nr:hypothetical protein [Los Azufres archaeal virus 1]